MRSIFNAMRFEENPFTCQYEKEDKKAEMFQISHFYGSLSNDIMAVKGLMSSDVSWHIRDKLRPSMVQYSFTSTEARRFVRTDSPGRPPRLSHSSWTMVPNATVHRPIYTGLPASRLARSYRLLCTSPCDKVTTRMISAFRWAATSIILVFQ